MRWLAGSAGVEIERPMAVVWGFLTDLENMPDWLQGVSEPALTPGAPAGVAPSLGEGSTFRSQYTYAGRTQRMDYVVTAFEPPRVYAVASRGGPFPFQVRMTLAPQGTGVRVEQWIRAGSDSRLTSLSFVLLGPLLRRMMRRQIAKRLLGLKALLEADGPEADGSETEGLELGGGSPPGGD